ncbi:MAG TPA: hypothetical protein VIX87_06680 [Steroidobacteraceae bacterium]
MHQKIAIVLLGLLALAGAGPLLAQASASEAAAANPPAPAASEGPAANEVPGPNDAPNPNEPSVSQVYAAARDGHLDQAKQMMAVVLTNHPQSGFAHYVMARLDADLRNIGDARVELKTAEQLNPGLPFADPRQVADLRNQIGAPLPGATVTRVAPPKVGRTPAPRSFPWAMVLVVAAVIVIAWLLMRRRQAPLAPYAPYPSAVPNSSGMPGTMPPPGGFPNVVGGGSGLVGGIASGLAVGAGIAAGEELVRHAFESHGTSAAAPDGTAMAPEPLDEGASPDPGDSWDDAGGSSGDGGGDWS